MPNTLTIRPQPSSHLLLERKDCREWAERFGDSVFGGLRGGIKRILTEDGITGVLEDWTDRVNTFDFEVTIPIQLRESPIWEFWFREHNGWMVFGVNESHLGCLGGKHGSLSEPPAGMEVMTTKLVANRDLSPLKMLKSVKKLIVEMISPATDLHPFSELSELEVLILRDTGDVASLEPLSNLSHLKYLDLGRPRNVSSIAPLLNLGSLRVLQMRSLTKVVDWKPLSSLTGLKALTLEACGFKELSFLGSMTELEFLDIGLNLEITDLSPLARLTLLKELSLAAAEKVECLVPLSGLNELYRLELAMCSAIEDLSPLAGMVELESLSLDDCPLISDLRPLAGMKKLERLSLKDCWRIPVDHRAAVEAGDYGSLRSLLSSPKPALPINGKGTS